MPTRELLAPSQRAQFTELPAILDNRTLAMRASQVVSCVSARRLTHRSWLARQSIGR